MKPARKEISRREARTMTQRPPMAPPKARTVIQVEDLTGRARVFAERLLSRLGDDEAEWQPETQSEALTAVGEALFVITALEGGPTDRIEVVVTGGFTEAEVLEAAGHPDGIQAGLQAVRAKRRWL